jgi:hypothetical protein
MNPVLPVPLGSEVVLSAMSTVFLLAGATLATVGVRMRRSRTYLSMTGDELTLTNGTTDEPEHVRVEEIDRVDVEIADDTYRARLVVRDGRTIALSEAMTSSRRHHERVVIDVQRFLEPRCSSSGGP